MQEYEQVQAAVQVTGGDTWVCRALAGLILTGISATQGRDSEAAQLHPPHNRCLFLRVGKH